MQSKSAAVREKLDHPVIDGDGHWLEPVPVYLEYLRDLGGSRAVDALVSYWKQHKGRWYEMSRADTQRNRVMRPPYWTLPGNALDRATGLAPGLFYKRLDEFGIDYAIVYPSMGPTLLQDMYNPDIRRTFVRALNVMSADLFRPYADRMTPVALVPMFTPQEAIEEAEFAVKKLGMKVIAINGTIYRSSATPPYVDSLAMDSPHDYDPVWAKFVELKVAVTTHTGAIGWSNRNSPSSFVANHLGHFAEGHHLFARSVFLGGVTQRFPKLAFGFLEGGAGWGCNLYSDMVGHWKKRNLGFMHKHLMQTNIDLKQLKSLLEENVTEERYRRKIAAISDRNFECVNFDRSAEELSERDKDADEFAAVKIDSPKDIQRIFSRNFFFGCEADDPMTPVAFDQRHGFPVRPMFSSDISHWDVPDPSEVLEEAWELVDDGLMSATDFRKFTFENVVALHTANNPDFFKDTVVEKEVTSELQRAAG